MSSTTFCLCAPVQVGSPPWPQFSNQRLKTENTRDTLQQVKVTSVFWLWLQVYPEPGSTYGRIVWITCLPPLVVVGGDLGLTDPASTPWNRGRAAGRAHYTPPTPNGCLASMCTFFLHVSTFKMFLLPDSGDCTAL